MRVIYITERTHRKPWRHERSSVLAVRVDLSVIPTEVGSGSR